MTPVCEAPSYQTMGRFHHFEHVSKGGMGSLSQVGFS